MTLGTTIYLWREERGLTQHALARRAGMSRPNLSMIEHGERDVTVRTLRRIARALGVRPGVLVDEMGPERAVRVEKNRECLDRIARYVVSQSGRLGRQEKKIALSLRNLLKRRLGHAEVFGARLPRTARSELSDWYKVRAQLGSRIFGNLLSRIDKISRLSA